jgi:hypothetical protein
MGDKVNGAQKQIASGDGSQARKTGADGVGASADAKKEDERNE